MAIIDPAGLFEGERLAACSDVAQLYWPRLFLAANSCARLELSYPSVISKFSRILETLQDKRSSGGSSRSLSRTFSRFSMREMASGGPNLSRRRNTYLDTSAAGTKRRPRQARKCSKSTATGTFRGKRPTPFPISLFGNLLKVSNGKARR